MFLVRAIPILALITLSQDALSSNDDRGEFQSPPSSPRSLERPKTAHGTRPPLRTKDSEKKSRPHSKNSRKPTSPALPYSKDEETLEELNIILSQMLPKSSRDSKRPTIDYVSPTGHKN